jgi:hypothetical protein
MHHLQGPEDHHRQTMAVFLALSGASLVVLGIGEVSGIVSTRLPVLAISMIRLALAGGLAGAAFYTARMGTGDEGLACSDAAAHAGTGALLGGLSAMTDPVHRPLYLLGLITVVFVRCLVVTGAWRGATAGAVVAWSAWVAAYLSLGGAPDGAWWAEQAVYAGTAAIAVLGARWLSTSHRRARGRYRIEGQIGAGATGEVYSAWDTHLERACAIKLLHGKAAADPRQRLQFLEEIRATTLAASQGVVAVHDYGITPDGRPFFVMEQLSGRDLESLVREQGPLTPERALILVDQCAAVLQSVHAAGVAHCDVKPTNVYVVQTGPYEQVKLLDFGFATRFDATPMPLPMRITGTAGYLAPERFDGLPADAGTDVYALGAVLYFLLSGMPAFDGQSSTDIVHNQLDADPPAVSSVRGGLPLELDELVSHCLDRRPQKRFADMLAVRRAIAKIRRTLGMATPGILRRHGQLR